MGLVNRSYLRTSFRIKLVRVFADLMYMKYYSVNTNKKVNPDGHDEATMLNEEIAAVHFEEKKKDIEKLRDGDCVFIYSNKVGIVGFGLVSGRVYSRPYQSNPKNTSNEYFVRLIHFVKLKKPLSDRAAFEVLGQAINIRKAVSPMKEEYAAKLYSYLTAQSKGDQAA